MRLIFVNNKYGETAGGIERVSLMIANDFVLRGHSVGLMSWDEETAVTHYPVSNEVDWIKIRNMNAKDSVLKRLSLSDLTSARRQIKKIRPDIVLCFQPGTFLFSFIACFGLGIPIAIAERHSPQRYDFSRSSRWRIVIFLIMHLASRIFVQMDAYLSLYSSSLHKKIRVIPNPVEIPDTAAFSQENQTETRRILCIGRLDFQKNQDVLLRAFSTLWPNFPNWRVVLVGDGQDLQYLQEVAKNLGCFSQVEFTGRITDVSSQYLNANIFCLPSRWEGFPNTLIEAMAHGLPCVGFSKCDGVAHLIQDNVTGILADGNGSTDSLVVALRILMSDTELRRQMGVAGRAIAAEYKPQKVMDQWEKELGEIAR